MNDMIEKISTLHMSRAGWLAERRGSIGGSDAGAILGLNPYRSPYAVWAEKTGRLPEQEDNEAMRKGRDLEEYTARRFVEKTGKRVERCNYLLRNTDAPHLHANIDRRVLGEKAGLECKTASALRLKSYRGGQFPESYYVQCAAYLAVTGWQRWYLAALVLGRAFHIYQITTVENDPRPPWCESSIYAGPEELSALKEFVSRFWEDYVEKDTPPPPDGAESTTAALGAVYSGGDGGQVELFGRTGILEEWDCLQAQRKELQIRQAQIKQTLMQDLGSAGAGICGDWSVQWTQQKRGTLSPEKLRRAYPNIDLGKGMVCKTFRRFSIRKGDTYGTN